MPLRSEVQYLKTKFRKLSVILFSLGLFANFRESHLRHG